MLTKSEIVELFYKIDNKTTSIDDIVHFINSKKEPIEDEAVYLSENNKIDFSFDEIRDKTLYTLHHI